MTNESPEEQWSSPGRIDMAKELLSEQDLAKAKPLHEIVRTNLEHLWTSGDKPKGKGRQPENILIRDSFFIRRPDEAQPALTRLIKSRGVQLKLELLMLFEAQCRRGPGDTVNLARRPVAPSAKTETVPWREMLLARSQHEQTKKVSTPSALRSRQISEALTALEGEGLVEISRRVGSGRRAHAELRMLSEAGTPDNTAPYSVPNKRFVSVPREFFTNLWVFALTDAEIGAYFLLRYMRRRFPAAHADQGIFVTSEHREQWFRLKRRSWRSTEELRAFGLIEQQAGPRAASTGKVGDFKKLWSANRVLPVRYKIVDDALRRNAVTTVHQILTSPTPEDRARRFAQPMTELDKQLQDWVSKATTK